ncbi:MAG TPA: queuosine precursor transporter [Candidatus Saccharimonadales bacterium]|nr:queuosine precursor transporter [Candidatus Saccharimonadales bacterium]
MFKIEKMDFLVSFYLFCVVVTELMGAKTFPIATIGSFHLNATVVIFILPFIYAANDIIVEVFGKARAQSVVRSSLVMIFFLLLFSLLVTHLPASKRFLPTEPAYETIFGISARFSAASLIAFAISEFSDVFIFAKLRQKLGKSKLWLRTNVSNFASEFLDTAIFMILAFYAFDMSFMNNFSFIAGIAIPYWLLRCCMSIIETPLVYWGVRWLRKEK